jgi:hypothetical protein
VEERRRNGKISQEDYKNQAIKLANERKAFDAEVKAVEDADMSNPNAKGLAAKEKGDADLALRDFIENKEVRGRVGKAMTADYRGEYYEHGVVGGIKRDIARGDTAVLPGRLGEVLAMIPTKEKRMAPQEYRKVRERVSANLDTMALAASQAGTLVSVGDQQRMTLYKQWLENNTDPIKWWGKKQRAEWNADPS